MKTLVLGATGATGRQLVRQLLDGGHAVVAIVRSADKLHASVGEHELLTAVEGSVLEMGAAELATHVEGCGAAASCLGHNLTLKGMFGKPRKLVTQSVSRVCEAIRETKPADPVRFVLMNTTGNRNKDLEERRTFGEAIVFGLLGLLLPPQSDNVHAADYLRTCIGPDNGQIQWTVVRPDGLVDEDSVTDYSIHPSPVRSPVFNAGSTSRINVAHFMADLMTSDAPFAEWRGRMPVIYNKADNPADEST